MIRWLALAGVLGLVVSGASADEIIFRWVDRAGNLHLSDELADVPEPYYSLYREKLRQRDEARQQGHKPPGARAASAASSEAAASRVPMPKPAGSESAGGSIIEQEEAKRQAWKELVSYWRNELAAATEALAQADKRLGDLQANPILRLTPAVQSQLPEAQEVRRAALARVEKARHMLLETLPARAKKEGVPPAWLM
jgi:hypothetical protein